MTTAIPEHITPTRPGPATGATTRVLVLACGALAREIVDLVRINGWDHVDLACLPAILHNTPDAIPGAVRSAVERYRGRYTHIFVAYADCGTGGQLARECDALGVGMLKGPHCYAVFDGVDRFAARDEMTAFYLTDFLVRQFDAFVWVPLGLDRHPELRDSYFRHYERLVYLSQVPDPALVDLARDHAARLGLAFEHRPTGYGDLANALAAEQPVY